MPSTPQESQTPVVEKKPKEGIGREKCHESRGHRNVGMCNVANIKYTNTSPVGPVSAMRIGVTSWRVVTRASVTTSQDEDRVGHWVVL